MLKRLLPVLLALVVLLSACGPQGTPTLTSVEVEGTAVSFAWTIVAMTQLAIPTATPLPPTETPSPTPLATFTPLPTLEVSVPTNTQKATGACDGLMNVGEAGPKSSIRIENDSGGTATFSLWLGSPNAFGQCGFVPGISPLSKNEKRVISIPKGEFYAYALIAYPNGSSSNASGYVNNRVGDDHLFVVKIKKEVIVIP